MTDILERAVEAMRQMPPDTRDSMAQAILTLAGGDRVLDIADEHLAYVLEGLAQLERGEFATDEEIAEAFRSFGP